MILYATLGTNDLPRARAFYDRLMPTLGCIFLTEGPDEAGYGPPQGPVRLWVTRPYDQQAAGVGNGSMLALAAADQAAVDAFHAMALASGGSDEGAPGLRYSPGFYSCYVRDPDGNKLSAVHLGPG